MCLAGTEGENDGKVEGNRWWGTGKEYEETLVSSLQYHGGHPKRNGTERNPTKWNKTGLVVEIFTHPATRLEDQFSVPERRGTPDEPVTYPGLWRGLTPSPSAQIEATKDQSMGTEVVVPPTPLNKKVKNGNDRVTSDRWS